jgi:serine/threonine protein kinase
MSEPVMDQRLGKYQILNEIGRGGMAVVYKAYDPTLQRHVALKVLSPRLASENQVIRRFALEATTAANLKHPNIIVIHDVGGTSGYQFLVMELIEGRTLREEIRQVGALPLTRVVNITTQLASALDYAHQRGLIHRDIKPSNILLSGDDHATLTDFGLVRAMSGSRLTEAGASLGTLEYMSPEQLGGEEIDWRADVYSLGVVVYESLAAHMPFSGDTPYAIMMKVMYEPPPPLSQANPHLPPAVDRVVAQAMAKSPEERFRTASELATALYQVLAGNELELLDGVGARFRLHRGVTRVGRDPDNELIANVAQVSRHHAEIRSDGAACTVIDLNSTNGTFVNDQRLAPNQPRRLQPGDMLRFGPNVVYRVMSSATRAADLDATLPPTQRFSPLNPSRT